MKEVSLFALVVKQTRTMRFLLSFAGVFIVCTVLLKLTDPSLQTWSDAIWYGYMLVTTIGFGDLHAATLASRLISVVLGLYGVLAIGFICGVGASWLFEKVRGDESIARMIEQLEHVDTLEDRAIEDLQHRLQIAPAPALSSARPEDSSQDSRNTAGFAH